MKYFTIFFFIYILLFCGCQGQQRNSTDDPPSHQIWNKLLSENVREDGLVDYRGFDNSLDELDSYLELLSSHAPDREKWSEQERLAYWINAYNAFTVKLILDHYPVKSIQDLHPTVYVPGINTVWHRKFFKIGGRDTSLDEIEHSILRKEFNEPRIHFAINCASFSCPPLRDEAYTAEKIEEQLQEMAVRFINDPARNRISAELVQLSPIFDWFSEDFTTRGTLTDFLNRYSRIKIDPKARIEFLEYNWALNEAPGKF